MEEIIGRVYSTTNYNEFKFLKGNRPVKKSGTRWKELMKSLMEYGQLEPALVTPKMEVINGQHRLAACQILGIPFKYSISDKAIGAEHIAAANSATKWGYKEYVDFYVVQDTEASANYQRFKSIMDEFGLTAPCVNNIVRGGLIGANDIRNGKLKLSTDKYDVIHRCLTELYMLGYDKWLKESKVRSGPYWSAVTYAWRHPKVNMKRLIVVMFKNQYRIPSYSRVQDLLEALSRYYNFKLKTPSKIYLRTDYEQGRYRDWIEDTLFE